MKPTDKILHRLTILYYLFIVLIIATSVISFAHGFSMAFENKSVVDISSLSVVWAILFIANQVLVIVGLVWVLILFAKMCVIIGRSLKHKNPFDLRIVKIVYRYIIISFVVGVLSYLSIVMVDDLTLFDSAYDLISSALSSVSTIVMLLMFCEVLKIGHILKVEQDLTI